MMTEVEWKLKMKAMRREQHLAQGYRVDDAGTCWRSHEKQALKDDRKIRRAKRCLGMAY